MIVPMKKVSLLVMDKSKETALELIRELGVLHLEKKTAVSPFLAKLSERYSQLETAWGVLYAYSPKKKSPAAPPEFEGDLAGHVLALSERSKKLQDYMFNHRREKGRFEKWGEFDPQSFYYLAANGVNVYLYDISFDSYAKNAKDVPLVVLSKDKKNNSVRLLAFDKIPNERHWPLPERPLSVVNERNSIRMAEMSKIEAELTALSPLRKQLETEKKSILTDIEFETARAGMELIDEISACGDTVDFAVSWISGYVPASELGLLKRAASENGWALCAEDPAEDDTEVPTKLENNKLISLVYPVMNFLELSPGYREQDVSGWFLLFLTLFFGMIFGDAAYGAILLLIALVFIIKSSAKGVPLFIKFLLLMSISNFSWGVLTGSWFGIDIAKVPQILQNMSLPLIANVSAEPGWLISYNAHNFWIRSGLVKAYTDIEVYAEAVQTNLKLFCFTIALVHLGLAHIKRMIDTIRSPRALAELGQLAMLLGMYFVVLSMIVFKTGFSGVSPWQLCLLLGGFILVFVFANYTDSIIKSLAASCSDIITVLLNITGVFSDIMSYIRLWAVGLAGASIAATVNGFAGPLLGSFIFFVFGIALFAFGHSFNIVLNAMSFLVHGVRLNTLEFSMHIGIEWSGFAYRPFAKR